MLHVGIFCKDKISDSKSKADRNELVQMEFSRRKTSEKWVRERERASEDIWKIEQKKEDTCARMGVCVRERDKALSK